MAGQGVPKTGVKAISAVEKQRRALELRKAGATFEMIADTLGYKFPAAAHKAVTTALHNVIKEPAEEVRDMEVARLDAALFAIWSQVKAGNHGAIDRFIKIQDRRAAYLGLDAPKAYDFGGDLTQTIRIVGVPEEDI